MWQPRGAERLALTGSILTGVPLLGFAHHVSGLAYEFHLFFSIPVVMAAWYLGLAPGLLVAAGTIALWFYIDWGLIDKPAGTWPLFFNTGVRAGIALTGVWLLVQLRVVLDRETRLAREDTLTALPNRRAFYERGQAALALSRRQNTAFTAVFIDLDHFKQVNDEQGHQVGDALLMRVAQILREHMRTGDIAGRMGGDEFALLLPGMDGEAARAYVSDLRERLLAAMQARGWPVTFSIGVASYALAPDNLDRLITLADGLMYEAKGSGRDCVLLRLL